MESGEFPGFFPAALAPQRDEFVVAPSPPLSRLQRRAPRPLHLRKPATTCPVKSIGADKESSSSSSASCFSSKDPIPLLSPLVLPSMLEYPLIIPHQTN